MRVGMEQVTKGAGGTNRTASTRAQNEAPEATTFLFPELQPIHEAES